MQSPSTPRHCFDSAQQSVQGYGCDIEIIALLFRSGGACQTTFNTPARGAVESIVSFDTRKKAVLKMHAGLVFLELLFPALEAGQRFEIGKRLTVGDMLECDFCLFKQRIGFLDMYLSVLK